MAKAHLEGYFQPRTPLRDSISTTLNASSGRAGTFESAFEEKVRLSGGPHAFGGKKRLCLAGGVLVHRQDPGTIGPIRNPDVSLHSPSGVSFEVKIACIRALDKDFLPQAAPAVAQTAGSGRIRP
ncbi:hypothetical protein, partial [Rhizorhabdus histidinilytica]|uniref:hypothetical protein n=1 Tax=Rhizorhabdus histidinilytica TaxID=439228 RepID=UPI001ADC0FA6